MRRVIFFFLLLLEIKSYAQFPYGTTGLLHMPTADMQKDKTFMFGGSALNEHATPGWQYNTYNYFINITIFPFLEVAYSCTMNKGVKGNYWPESTWGKFTNQDRQFSGRLRVLKEGQLWKYMPAVVLGGNDVLTRDWQGSGEKNSDSGFGTPVAKGNGKWNRYYIVLTKHFDLRGELGIHVAYVYNRRIDNPLNGPAFGMNWKPYFHKNLNVMAEYDSKTPNCGLGYSFWKDHINFVSELNDFKYVSASVIFKVHLK